VTFPKGAVALLLLAAGAAAKDDCIPPAFYTSLPRDRDWYYGVARNPDTEKARDQALRNLGKQVGAEVEGWTSEKVAAVAGPCRDKWEVASSVGRLLPRSSLLAGWEQDDFERCDGQSYVLVRVEKERVERFMRGSGKFKSDVAAALSKRLDKVEAAVDELNARVERLEKALNGLPAEGKDSGAEIVKTVARVRADMKAGKPRAQIEKALASAEDAYSKLEARIKVYQDGHDAAERARLAALRSASAPELKAKLAAVEAGEWGYAEAGAIIGFYNDAKDFEGLRAFSRTLLARPDLKKLDGHDDFVAYMGIVADLSLKDNAALMADGEAFLKKYPASGMFEAVKAQLDGAIAMSRMAKPAPAAAPASVQPGPEPCAE